MTGSTRRPRRRPGENRVALLEAAVLEFGLNGFHGASTAEIAARAQVPQPHVYVHFSTKAELFLAALQSAYGRVGGDAAPQSADERSAPQQRSEALMHLQAIAVLTEPSLSPALVQMVDEKITAEGEGWHRAMLGTASEALLASIQEDSGAQSAR